MSIYLDYQATTPLAPEALAAMLPWLEKQHANPHSAHAEGRAAKAAVEAARAEVATLLPPGGAVSFTSGATEALNWAIKGILEAASKGRSGLVTLATEHAAILDTAEWARARGHDVTVLPVGQDGLVDLDAAEAAVGRGPALISAMLVNNEIGVIQNIGKLAEIAHAFGIPFLCDAVQGAGRVAVPDNCDLVAISAHKMHGPKGIGALWLADGMEPRPLLHGGSQEVSGRSGTLSPALCAGFGAAARLMREKRETDRAHVERLWRTALDTLGEGWIVNGSTEHRYRGNLNIRFAAGLDVARLMSDLRDISFSVGSACASGSGRPSHVLRAIGLSDAEARSSIRFGFGRYTTEAELVDALTRIDAAARAQRVAA